MKLNDLIIKLEEMNCVEQTIETKGELVNYKCDNDYNLPYKLKPILPYMKEKTIFNFMQDGRRGMWVNKVYLTDGLVDKLVLIQLMFNREGDDNIFTFVINHLHRQIHSLHYNFRLSFYHLLGVFQDSDVRI